MKQFFKMFFASLFAMVVAGVILVGIIMGAIVGLVSKASSSDGKETKVKASSVLVIDVAKKFHEQGMGNSFASLSNEPSYASGIYDLTEAIKYAKTDNNIKGILLKLSASNNGWATLQQLRMALADFKSSNKFIYAYGEGISQGAYYIASIADSVYLNPVGAIELKGFATVMPFFKITLEKLEVQPEIYYAGKFKSATEPFRADKISDPNRLQIQAYQHDLWSEFTTAAAQHAHTDTATIDKWTATGAIQFPQDALKYKLVDGLLYWDEVEQRLRAKTGQKEKEEIKYVTVDDYRNSVRSGSKISENKIAVLFAEGDISDGEQDDDYAIGSKNLVESIRKLKDNDKVKAVVLRVNSPGGSGLASDVILRELDLLKAKKPLVVSMGDYAASGGYFIACHADSIFALPNTITGSIGVFSVLFNFQGLLKNKLGVSFDEVKTAPYADFPSVSRPLSPDEAERMQASIDTFYSMFKSRVSTGRKISVDEVDSIAQGRVWTGTAALGIHLVDALGNLDRAILSASKLAKVGDYKVVTYPEPGDKLDAIMRRFKGNSASAMMSTAIKQQLGTDYDWYRQVASLRKMNGRAMMAMPFVWNVE
jgi:protease-4